MFDKNGYYNTNKIKSYDARYYVVTSERGIGKTYSEKRALFRAYTRHGYKFIVIYRTGSDLADSAGKNHNNWLDPLINPHKPFDKSRPVPLEDFEWVNENSSHTSVDLKYQGDTIGYFRTLSSVNHIKQDVFPETVSEIFFDEFTPMNYTKIPGIDDEYEALETVIDTVDHDLTHPKHTRGYPKVKTVLFGNPRNRNSIFYTRLHLPALKYGVFRVNRDVVCEFIEPIPENTEGGLGRNARKCVMWLDKKAFIKEKLPPNSWPWLSVRIYQAYYAFYQYFDKQTHQVETVICSANGHTKGCDWRFGTLEKLGEDEVCINANFDGETANRSLKIRANKGTDYYDSPETRQAYLNDLGTI